MPWRAYWVSRDVTNAVRVSILIKALNEDAKIARCLEAAVHEISKVGGEVILVDSLSTDRTVEIAKAFPVRIVQFENAADRGCGAAVQLGYQFARGEFLYLIDGDMVLQPGFLKYALEYLKANSSVAGVGGLMIDTQTNTSADKRRAQEYATITQVSTVDYLGGGGLYRSSAIHSLGYLAHRGLKACEEAELGVRLRKSGWTLSRLPVIAISHTGHNESNIGMLWRLWRNGRMHAHGTFLRSALGQPWWWKSARIAWFVFAPLGLYSATIFIAWLCTLLGMSVIKAFLLAIAIVLGSVFVVLSVKKRSISEAVLAIVAWHFYMIAAAIAGIRAVPDPFKTIMARELTLGK